jgi:hypothetical protein
MLALIVDPVALDHARLRLALKSLRCEIISVSNLAQARKVLRTKSPALILCERDLLEGNWHDLLRENESPLLIVTSRLTDERLWSDVLRLGERAEPWLPNQVHADASKNCRSFDNELIDFECCMPPLTK